MAKQRELAKELYASRIWRTVVFAGAMLGAPTIAAGDSPAQPPPPPPQKTATKPVPPLPPAKPTPVEAAQDKAKKIETLDGERKALYARLVEVDVKEIDKLKKDIVAKDSAIKKLVDELVTVRKPRPRAVPTVRPVGRGFVLA